MHSAFRIYDEQTLNGRLRLKRVQVLAIFVAGTGCGLWLSASEPGEAMAAAPAPAAAIAASVGHEDCAVPGPDATSLRMECELKSLQR